MIYQLNEFQKLWLEDLKTTEEPQTKGALHRTKDDSDDQAGYCCLGRAAAVIAPDKEFGAYDGISRWYGESRTLPRQIWEKLNLNNDAGGFSSRAKVDGFGMGALTELNDELGWSFKQIAEWIEENPELVWSDYEEQNDNSN